VRRLQRAGEKFWSLDVLGPRHERVPEEHEGERQNPGMCH
jgi:hypothetical protein